MKDEQRRRGRPKSPFKVRDSRLTTFLTKEDHGYLDELAEAMGFKSTSEMVTAILERLCQGGFSPLAFIKLGWQIANMPTKRPRISGYYLDLRPPAPLLPPEPDEEKTSEILEEVKRQLAGENCRE